MPWASIPITLLSIYSVFDLHEGYASVFFGYLLLFSGYLLLLCIIVIPYSTLRYHTITQTNSYNNPCGSIVLVLKGLYLLLICLTSSLSVL
jgi:hypothetical protein